MSLPTQSEPSKDRAFPQSGTPASAPRPRRIRPLTWILLLAILGSIALQQIPLEIGRWHLAVAIRHRQKGEKEAAYEALVAAMQRFPNNPSLLLRRAEWRLADGELEAALADSDQARALNKDNPQALIAHADVLWKAGKFDEAVEDWKLIEDHSRRSGQPPREEALNGLAYARALAKTELEDALTNVNQAIELLPAAIPQDPLARARQFYSRAQVFDTRGYILHLLGRDEEAITDMDSSVDDLQRARLEIGDGKPTAEKAASSSRNASSPSFPEARSTAVIHYHRSLVLVSLGRKDDAKKDIEIVRRLIGDAPLESLY